MTLKPKSKASLVFEIILYIAGIIMSVYLESSSIIQQKRFDFLYVGLLGCFIFSTIIAIRRLSKSIENEQKFIDRYNELMDSASAVEDEMTNPDEMLLDDLFIDEQANEIKARKENDYE